MLSNTQIHMLAFEGPDRYARAGGIASRVIGLGAALGDAGADTHLWFVGDPDLPGHETGGQLSLHRWCQWISRGCPGGVYDGEQGKCVDYSSSLPPYLLEHHVRPALARGERVVILAEEWQTVGAVLHLDWLLRLEGVRERVSILWNANNTFGFELIDWARLSAACTVVTVSRYMKHRMWLHGVDPIVIPNGLSPENFVQPELAALCELRTRFADRLVLTKVARWDPDKRWLLAADIVAALKRRGLRPLLIARGGMEAHEAEVMLHARRLGLRVTERNESRPGARGLLDALASLSDSDVVLLRFHLDHEARGVLLRGSDAVLANSGHEPFGLVGLETMAVGGLACTGASGEDYAVDGENALVLQRNDPEEFGSLYARLKSAPRRDEELRSSAIATARTYAWSRVVDRTLLPRI